MAQQTVERKNTQKKGSSGRKTKIILFSAIAFLIIAVCIILGYTYEKNRPSAKVQVLYNAEIPDWIDSQILPVTSNSRRNISLEDITAIAIHYVANPGSTAQNNRNYYENADTEVNSHFIVGLEGEIIQCIPLGEKSSATNDRNRDTISIEVCHPDETGKFNDSTYDSLVKLTAWLCKLCNLDETGIIRHYDVTGKLCPLYFVEHEDAWLQFRADVMDYKNSAIF